MSDMDWNKHLLDKVAEQGVILEQQAAQIEALRAEKADADATAASALRLVTDIRFALGDDGKRMQDELIEFARALRADAEQMRSALNFIAERMCSDWSQRCQAMVNTARAALRQEQPT